MSKILSVRKLSAEYRVPEETRRVLREVSLEIEEGKILAVVGESGCGKSTLVNCAGMLLPDNAQITEGEIEIDGTNVIGMDGKQLKEIRKNRIGIVFQDPFSTLDESYTIEKQLIETLRIKKKTAKTAALQKSREMLEACGIADAMEILKKYPHELSGGLRQRVMIAMALINEPKLLIADEPTTALDVTVQKEILDLLRKLARERKLAVMFVTHSMDVAFNIADEVAVLYGGRVMEYGTARELYYSSIHPYTQALLKTIPSIKYGKNERKLIPIEGELFDFREIEGCCFEPRCPYANEDCRRNEPQERNINGHRFRCRYNEVL